MAVEVLRFDTQQVLEGELNGRALEQSFSFAQELTDSTAASDTGAPGSPTSYRDYVSITDDTGQADSWTYRPSGATSTALPGCWTAMRSACR